MVHIRTNSVHFIRVHCIKLLQHKDLFSLNNIRYYLLKLHTQLLLWNHNFHSGLVLISSLLSKAHQIIIHHGSFELFHSVNVKLYYCSHHRGLIFITSEIPLDKKVESWHHQQWFLQNVLVLSSWCSKNTKYNKNS